MRERAPIARRRFRALAGMPGTPKQWLSPRTRSFRIVSRRDAVETSWSWIQPVLDFFEAPGVPPPTAYAAGSWGPAEADRLIRRDRRQWREP